MSKLEELIQQYCPDGVEWMPLKDIATQWYRGAGIKREEVSEDGIPCIRYGEIHTTYSIWFDECVSHTEENKQISRKYADYGDILFAITSEDIPFIGNSVAYVGSERILVGGDIVVMKHSQNPKYIAYALSTNDAIKQKGKGKVKSKVVHTNVPSLQEIVIPVPPLPVQEEIVRILDIFTELQAELQAELQKRKSQYSYYLDNLLSFNKWGGYQTEIRRMKLKDVCMKTNNIKWKSATGQYRYIDLSSVDIQTHSIISAIEIDKMSAPSRAQQIVQGNDVIFATTRPTQMRACIIPTEYNGDICSTGYCVLRVDKKILLPRFLFFSLTVSNFKAYLSNNLTLGNYPSISNSALLEYEVPVPSLADQQKIVSILDRFDRLTNDLSSGLPAEMKKRRQQYEYYRDKLLSFKRKGA